jgi:hypothetical protein
MNRVGLLICGSVKVLQLVQITKVNQYKNYTVKMIVNINIISVWLLETNKELQASQMSSM